MGHGGYSVKERSVRAEALNYASAPVEEIFVQSKLYKIHDAMNPNGVVIRESCDSAEHPNTTPIQFYLDVTGSMGHIPHEMIKEGLPKLVGSLIQNGVPDVTLMFGAIGDHECDVAPLQVGQFEASDEAMDMWLTRTWLEGNGGGNRGESYLLAWYFAGFHTRIDAFDKRGKKGFVFTIGDEPCLKNLPHSAVAGIMGTSAVGQGTYTSAELLAKAQEKNHVYHIFLEHGGRTEEGDWKQLLGDHLIVITDYKLVSKTISDIVLSHQKPAGAVAATTKTDEERPVIFL